MKRIWPILILLLASIYARSQEYLNIKLPKDGHYGLWAIIDAVEYEDNIWFVGSQYHPITGNAVRVLGKLNHLNEIDTTILLTNPIEVSLTPSILIHDNFILI